MDKESLGKTSKKILSGISGTLIKSVDTVIDAGSKLDFNLFSDSARIAVVGASRSGKTVLLTSLIDHLRNHDPRRFRLTPSSYSKKKAATITNYAELEVDSQMTPFPFESFRQALIHDTRWPNKTRDTYQYRLKVYRDDSAMDRVVDVKFSTTLTFLDFPGERIADALITSLSYNEWSDHMINNLPGGAEFASHVEEFSQEMAAPTGTEQSILSAYKKILAKRVRQFHTTISPSTFVLCPNGTTPKKQYSVDDLVETRFTGLSVDNQFCPLSAPTRTARPHLTAKFNRAYIDYQESLILPLYNALAKSDHLCILVNIPEILQSGVEAYNDHIELLQQIVAFCSPKRNAYVDILRKLTKEVGKVFIDDAYRPGGIEKVAFVGTQADRIRPEDVNRLKKLTRELMLNCTRALPHVDIKMDEFTCVAVQATKPGESGKLQGRLMTQDSPSLSADSIVEEYDVSPLPEEWPSDWKGDDFLFPDVWPKFHHNKHTPSEQIGLDRIFNYLIS